MQPEELMKMAIEHARAGIAIGQTPFGCAIAHGEAMLTAAHNTVHASVDITAHAEVNAIRQACSAGQNIFLHGAIAATTCEPCPMCMAALHWARVEVVYYGATISDAAKAGFNELSLPADELLSRGGSGVKLIGGVLREQCAALFEHWQQQPNAAVY